MRRLTVALPTVLRRPCAIVSACLALLIAQAGSGQEPAAPGDTTVSRDVAPGVTLTRMVRARGPFAIHVLAVDLRRRELAVRAVRACDRLTGRERPSAIVRRLRADGVDVIAALNAGFFDLEGGTGASESNLVLDGEIVKGVETTESPFDRFDNAHSQFGMTEAGRPVIDRFSLTGTVRTPRGRWPLGTVNGAPLDGQISLYSEWSDRLPAIPAGRRSAAVPVLLGGARGDTAHYRVVEGSSGKDTTDRSGTRVSLLVGTGRAADAVARLAPGDRLTVIRSFAPSTRPLAALTGGWPRIVRGGVNVALSSDSAEGTWPAFSTRRHPRSAVGISRDSSRLYLVAVDGRRKESVGMTLDELAETMIAFGAHDALNLDGGGSTSLVVGDSVVNTPSDTTGERAVGDVIVITRQAATATSYPRRVHPAKRIAASCVMSGNRDPDRVPAPAPK